MTDTPTLPDFIVDRTPAREWTAETATVSVTLSGDRVYSVTIYGPDTRYGGKYVAAQVNWSAIGGVSAEDATLYAQAIALAASIAPTLSPPIGKPESDDQRENEA